MKFITPITRNCSGNDFYNNKHSNFGIFLRIFYLISVFGQILGFLRMVFFAQIWLLEHQAPF